MYENVPEGSVILWELWDDPLPKSIPGEPGMDMGSQGLRNIDWSPYEEDTAAKYEILKAKLREADYVAYSSKRIYDSVDELPQRYPMTTRYYDAMWDGSLGYELAMEATSPPRLFGFTFDDRHADESWSLYDHPQVSVFRKVRDLSDAEFDAVLGGSWEQAVAYDTGELSLLSRPLVWLGLRGGPGAEYEGAFGAVLRMISGQEDSAGSADRGRPAVARYAAGGAGRGRQLPLERLGKRAPGCGGGGVVAGVDTAGMGGVAPVLPPVWFISGPGVSAEQNGGLAAGGLAVVDCGQRGGVWTTSVRNAWIAATIVAVAGGFVAFRSWREMRAYLGTNWPLLLAGRGRGRPAFAGFLLIRMANPDLWQPWYGGEKFMEFAFLNGILRSPTFPPVDPHFAGGFINYYYFGIYLAAYLIKLTGIYAEVAFNLTIAMLFALTVSNAFSIAYTAYGRFWRGQGARRTVLAHGTGGGDACAAVYRRDRKPGRLCAVGARAGRAGAGADRGRCGGRRTGGAAGCGGGPGVCADGPGPAAGL